MVGHRFSFSAEAWPAGKCCSWSPTRGSRLERLQRRGGAWTENGRELDAETNQGWHPRAHGANGVPTGKQRNDQGASCLDAGESCQACASFGRATRGHVRKAEQLPPQSEQPLDLTPVVEANDVGGRGARQTRHGHDLAGDGDDELG